MIYVRNTTRSDQSYPGECTYEVGINFTPMGTFVHQRADGIVACLRAAADALEKGGYGALDPDNMPAARRPPVPRRRSPVA